MYLDSPIRSESGSTELSSGWQNFYYIAKDDEDSDESREGYPDKSWFWGAYDFAGNTSLKSKAFSGTTGVFEGGTRGAASGRTDSHSSYWWQHDYFAHSGQEGSGSYQRGRLVAKRMVHVRSGRVRRKVGAAVSGLRDMMQHMV